MGSCYQCATRRLLKHSAPINVTSSPPAIVSNFARRKETKASSSAIEPRHGMLSRAVRGRQHVIVTNVDQLLDSRQRRRALFEAKPHRSLSGQPRKNKIRPLIVINKVDLIDRASLEPMVGVYSQMGYRVLLASARDGIRHRSGAPRAGRLRNGRRRPKRRRQVVAIKRRRSWLAPAQSAEVSEETQKGRHTTTTARLLPLAAGGYVVDTPGIRQFQLWDVVPRRDSWLLSRHSPVCQQVPLSRLHAHARGRLRREGRRGRRLARCPALRKLLPPLRG